MNATHLRSRRIYSDYSYFPRGSCSSFRRMGCTSPLVQPAITLLLVGEFFQYGDIVHVGRISKTDDVTSGHVGNDLASTKSNGAGWQRDAQINAVKDDRFFVVFWRLLPLHRLYRWNVTGHLWRERFECRPTTFCHLKKNSGRVLARSNVIGRP